MEAWGLNNYGQLGLPPAAAAVFAPSIVLVAGGREGGSGVIVSSFCRGRDVQITPTKVSAGAPTQRAARPDVERCHRMFGYQSVCICKVRVGRNLGFCCRRTLSPVLTSVQSVRGSGGQDKQRAEVQGQAGAFWSPAIAGVTQTQCDTLHRRRLETACAVQVLSLMLYSAALLTSTSCAKLVPVLPFAVAAISLPADAPSRQRDPPPRHSPDCLASGETGLPPKIGVRLPPCRPSETVWSSRTDQAFHC